VFGRIGGWPVRWRHGSTSQRPDVNDNDVSIDGKPLRRRHGLPWSSSLEAVALGADDADMLANLIDIGGHHFPFDIDAHAESGLGPDTAAAGNWSIVPATLAAGVHGNGYLNVFGSIVWDPSLPTTWTVMAWRNVTGTAEHITVTSSGRKFSNGVRNDALVTTELLVSNGAVALTAGNYDDLVILPYELTDEFVAAFVRWTLGRALAFAVHYGDGSGRDVGPTQLATSSPTSTAIRRTGGKWNGAGVFVGGDSMTYVASPAHSLNGRVGFSVEDWVWLDTDLGFASRFLADHGATSSGLTAGWEVIFSAAGDNTFGVLVRAVTTGGVMAVLTASGAKLGVTGKRFVHVIATFDAITGRATVYIDGIAASVAVETSASPGSAFANDSAQTLRIGGAAAGTFPMLGRSSGLRCYGLVLTAAEVLEHFRAGIAGNVPTSRRPFSPLPGLDFCGDLTDGKPMIVVGQTADQAIVQRSRMKATEKVWVNNARDVPVQLDEVIDRDVGRLPEPLWSFNLSDPYFDIASLRFRAAAGDLGDGVITTQRWNTGPMLRRMRSRDFVSAAADRVQLNAEHSACVQGLTAYSVVAWIFPFAASAGGIANAAFTASTHRWTMSMTSSLLVFNGRGAGTDTLRTQTSIGTIAQQRWSMVGGWMDIANNQMGVFANGCGLAPHLGGFYELGAQVFASIKAGGGGYAPNTAIGVGSALATPFNGPIAHVALYPRRLTAAEALRIYRAGLAGIFR